MANKKVLVIGFGEVGKAIAEIEAENRNFVVVTDIDIKAMPGTYDVIHICIPFKEMSSFIGTIRGYLRDYISPINIIHSTVAIGTTERILGCIHSPVQGTHPTMTKGIKTYKKFFGGSFVQCKKAMAHFEELGIKTEYLGDSKTTEIAKLLDTTYYGWNIVFATKAASLCSKYKVDFSKAYTAWNTEYNTGLKKEGREQFTRPILTPNKGGFSGHCVFENAVLLNYPELSTQILKIGKKNEKGRTKV